MSSPQKCVFFCFCFCFARLSYIVNWAWSPWFNDIHLTRRNTRTTKSQVMGCEYSQISSLSRDYFITYVWPCPLSGAGVVVNLSHRRPEFEPRVVHVEFMVNKVVPEQISLRIVRVSPVKIISPTLHTHVSFIYLRHYKILATDSIIKSPATTIRHVQFVPSITVKGIISKP